MMATVWGSCSRESAASVASNNSNISKKSPCNPEIPSGEDELWNLEFVVWPSVFALILKCWWQSIINVGLSVSPSFFSFDMKFNKREHQNYFWKYYVQVCMYVLPFLTNRPIACFSYILMTSLDHNVRLLIKLAILF